MLPAGAWAAGSDLEHCADAPGVLGISALLAKPRSGTCQPHPGLQLRPNCFPRVTPRPPEPGKSDPHLRKTRGPPLHMHV